MIFGNNTGRKKAFGFKNPGFVGKKKVTRTLPFSMLSVRRGRLGKVSNLWQLEEKSFRILLQLSKPFSIILNDFFARIDKPRPKLRCSNLQKLSRADAASLEAPFSEAEIWEVLKDCDGNRAPGTNNFNLNFFKTF